MSLAFDEYGRPFIIIRVSILGCWLGGCELHPPITLVGWFVSAIAASHAAGTREQDPGEGHRGGEGQYPSGQGGVARAAHLAGAQGNGQDAAEPRRRYRHQ